MKIACIPRTFDSGHLRISIKSIMCGLSQTVGSHEEIVCVCNCLFCLICTEFCLQGADGMVVDYCCFLSCCDQTTPHRVSLAITNKPPMLVCWALNQDTVGMDWLAYRAALDPKSGFEQINLNEISSLMVHPEWQRATDFQDAQQRGADFEESLIRGP